ncbi:unnamed protein product [Parnassius apollo]|uniref:(apollo) hypothetical protein n=1 Tax=Parnassius apollo TaxID=110799 RepID=A0A8S3WK79_PARAO|nr:unnamed protein product [Parnassius apollo]
MKLSILILFCYVFTILSPRVKGDVVVDLFGKIQESAQKIEDDIKSVFQSKSRRDSQYRYESMIVFKNDEDAPDKTTATNVVTSTQVPVTTVKGDSNSKTNGTEQDGRENFRGACATGYERTADGRCKPTF